MTAVVLLHAFPLDERMWEPQRELLSGREVVAPRLYELGRSMDEWAEETLRLVEGPFVVVGASMGGYAALAMARRAPERLRGLLLEGSRTDADSPERRAGRADTIRLAEEGGAAAIWEAMREKVLSANASAEVVERARALALEQDPQGLVYALEAIRDRVDATGVAQALEIPMRAVVGSEDPFVTASELAEALGAEAVVEIEGAGHLPSFERPDAFNPVLEELLRSTP